MTKARLRAIKQKVRNWRAISEDNDPIGTMCDVVDELIKAIEEKKP